MNSIEPNAYSKNWFDFFHATIANDRTDRETEFICVAAPLPDFERVLDLCCGLGRHARALARRGYSVTGIDRDADAIRQARESGGGPDYIVSDFRNYTPAPAAFDVAIVMGQSFGYFDRHTNVQQLDRLASSVRTGGRIILDLWNPQFFIAHQGERELATTRGIVRETKHVDAGRLFVHLEYPDGAPENFEWELFTPAQMDQLAKALALSILVYCTDFNAATEPRPDNPRIQFILERQ